LRDLTLGGFVLDRPVSGCLTEPVVFIGWYLPNGPYRLAWHLRKISLLS
jgi:hypothetical protein